MSDTDDAAERRAAHADLLAGGVFVALGAGFAIGAARQYERGSALQMGPGYVPLLLGAILAALGLVIIGQGVTATVTAGRRAAPTDAVPAPHEERGRVPWLRGGLLIAAIVMFGLTVRGLGLATALFITTFLAALAGHRTTPIKAAVVATGLTVLCLVVFVSLLQLRLPLLGTWLGG